MNSSIILEGNTEFDGPDSNVSKESFYSPLCLSGYLTPLQRKKLREKRNLSLTDYEDNKPNNSGKTKKPRTIHTKKNDSCHIRGKINKISQKTNKENSPNTQFLVSKVISKATNNSIKDKKFFKTDSCSRLEKATFTFSLVSKKNLANFDQINKENAQKQLKRNVCPENESTSKNLESNTFHKLEVTTTPILMRIENIESKLSSEPVCFNNDSVHGSREKDGNLMETATPSPEKDIFDFNWPSDDILLERQRKARNIIRTQHIVKKATNEKNEHAKLQESENHPIKLYPIFHVAIRRQMKKSPEIKRSPKSIKSVKSSGGGEQMIIDAGQKEIGAKVCTACGMVYTIGQEDDEKLHSNYHDTYLNLRFTGWKDEQVIAEYADGRVIIVRKDEKSFKLKKIQEVLEIANRDLGFPNAGIPVRPELTFLLYVSNEKRIVGLIVAEPISMASKLILADKATMSSNLKGSNEKVFRIGNWYSSFEKVPAVCGVNRIWVDHNFRRHKVASRMIDCLRCNFIHGHVIGLRELAFTDPSPDGREFAAAYTGTDNFLVYR